MGTKSKTAVEELSTYMVMSWHSTGSTWQVTCERWVNYTHQKQTMEQYPAITSKAFYLHIPTRMGLNNGAPSEKFVLFIIRYKNETVAINYNICMQKIHAYTRMCIRIFSEIKDMFNTCK